MCHETIVLEHAFFRKARRRPECEIRQTAI
jgi:hypothetical protein